MAETSSSAGADSAYIEPINSEDETYEEIQNMPQDPSTYIEPTPAQSNNPNNQTVTQTYIEPTSPQQNQTHYIEPASSSQTYIHPSTSSQNHGPQQNANQHRGSMPGTGTYSTQIGSGARSASIPNAGGSSQRDVEHHYLPASGTVYHGYEQPPPPYTVATNVGHASPLGYQVPGPQPAQPRSAPGPHPYPTSLRGMHNPAYPVPDPRSPVATQPGFSSQNVYHEDPTAASPVFHQPHYQPQPTKIEVQAAGPAEQPKKSMITTMLAVFSMIISILAFCCCVNICCTVPALVLASQSLSSSTNPEKAKAYAIASIVLSAISVVSFIIIIIVIVNINTASY